MIMIYEFYLPYCPKSDMSNSHVQSISLSKHPLTATLQFPLLHRNVVASDSKRFTLFCDVMDAAKRRMIWLCYRVREMRGKMFSTVSTLST